MLPLTVLHLPKILLALILPFTVLTSPLTSPLILILPFVTSTDLQSPWIFKVPKTGTSKFSTLPSILILIIYEKYIGQPSPHGVPPISTIGALSFL